MMEFLEFTFQSFERFVGVTVLIVVTGIVVMFIVRAIKE